MGERKGGGTRRGPFANKRVPFATRLTQETMDMLAQAAERDELSISQKAEQLLLAGLRAEDAFERNVAPVIEAFRDAAQRAFTENEGRSPREDANVARLLNQAAREFAAAFPTLMTDLPAEEAKQRHVRVSRQLLVDDPSEGEG